MHGARSIKKKYPEAVAVFIMTPDFKTLEERLVGRGTETEEAIKTRLGSAKRELSEYALFDYIVFNDDAEEATRRVLDIINAEKCRIKNNIAVIKNLLN